MHLCDIKNCCNPEHLQLGTNSENIIASLSYSKVSKLNEKKVKEIRVLLNNNIFKHKEISKKYNVSNATIYDIKTGRRWSHVKDTST